MSTTKIKRANSDSKQQKAVDKSKDRRKLTVGFRSDVLKPNRNGGDAKAAKPRYSDPFKNCPVLGPVFEELVGMMKRMEQHPAPWGKAPVHVFTCQCCGERSCMMTPPGYSGNPPKAA